jgi:hypothetical protein
MTPCTRIVNPTLLTKYTRVTAITEEEKIYSTLLKKKNTTTGISNRIIGETHLENKQKKKIQFTNPSCKQLKIYILRLKLHCKKNKPKKMKITNFQRVNQEIPVLFAVTVLFTFFVHFLTLTLNLRRSEKNKQFTKCR